jgi:ABC-2 type transport system permease protein
MTTPTHTLGDSATMLRRDLKHMIRYPSVTVMLIGMPVVLLLLFVDVLGGTLGDGLGTGAGGRAEYLTYVVPGILVIAICAVAQGTAISVAMDMTEGIIARFRTMAIARAAVLAGHVGGAMIQTLLAVVVVAGVAVAMGYRASATALQWCAAFGVLAMIAALTCPVAWAWPASRSVGQQHADVLFILPL